MRYDPLRWSPTRLLLVILALVSVLHCLCANAVPFAIPPPNKTGSCQYGISLEWTTRVGSSIFATPAIADLMHDGKKEILIPTFSQYLEAVNGANGEDVMGYPFVHPRFKSYASPLPVDIDGDGKVEWLVAMYTGELLLFNEEGKSRGLLKIPPLAVKRRWMDSRANSSFSSIADMDKYAAVHVKKSPRKAQAIADIMKARNMQDLYIYQGAHDAHSKPEADLAQESGGDHVYHPPREAMFTHARRVHTAAFEDPEDPLAEPRDDQDDRDDEEDDTVGERGLNNHADKDGEVFWQDEHDFDEDDVEDYFDPDHARDWMDPEYDRRPRDGYVSQQGIGPFGALSPEAKSSMKLLFQPDLYKAKITYDAEKDAFSAKPLRGWHSTTILPDEVAVDAHILSTPRIVDTDGDGDMSIIVHVSYFFDPAEYASPIFAKDPLPADVNPDNYIATAVVSVNLVTGDLEWVRPLHLTTKRDPNPAYALSSPLVINADRKDTALEIYVTSTTGSVVGLSSKGQPLPGWPVWLGPTTASPTAEDLLGNDQLNICVGDVEGGVKCMTSSGAVVWERNVIGGVTDHITFGDVNGDGQMDVVFGTTAGLVYALDGSSGATLPKFPIVTRGSVVAPVLLLNLKRRMFGFGLHNERSSGAKAGNIKYPPLSLVVPSHDGSVYIIHGRDGCIETIDIDEKASSMVLADDLTGNGHMDLLVTTISGGVYVFETGTAHHPLKAWSSKTKGLNGHSASENNVGIYISPDYRRPRDVRGDKFRLKINIEDFRPQTVKSREYAVSVYIGTRTRVFKGTFREAKEYSIQMRTPLERMYSSVTVVMTLPNGQVFSDTISLSFNMHFLTTIKYVLVIPFLCVASALMFVHKRHEVEMDN